MLLLLKGHCFVSEFAVDHRVVVIVVFLLGLSMKSFVCEVLLELVDLVKQQLILLGQSLDILLEYFLEIKLLLELAVGLRKHLVLEVGLQFLLLLLQTLVFLVKQGVFGR